MRRTIVAALVAGAVATPTAVVAAAEQAQNPERPDKPKPVVTLIFRGLAASDATSESLEIDPWKKGSNMHARRAAYGQETVTIRLCSATRLRGFITLENGKRRMVRETYEDIKEGDRVLLKVRAYKGESGLELSARCARWVKDYTAQMRPVEEPVV